MPGTSDFSAVLLVHNPHSTGGAERRARAFRDDLGRLAPHLDVRLVPTEYAGHAREIAAAAGAGTLVVSVSGDGGYNEVVSGVMDAGDGRRGRSPVAVLPAGNANDHRRTTAREPLAEAVAAGRTSRLDMLRVCLDDDGPLWAHSYVGVGITPSVAFALEKRGKGALREIVTTLRELARFRPFEIVHESGERERIDSLVLANISEIAKYATLSDDGDPTDGRFEVVTIRHAGKFRLLVRLIRAAVQGLGPQPTERHFAFRTTSPMPMQLDGEVRQLDGPRAVTVDVVPGAVDTVR